MAETVDELTVTYEDGGVETVKELDKKVLTKGAWATIMYRYQDWNRAKEEYGPDKYTIRRYQKRNGEYQQKSKFNISSKDQAKSIIEALSINPDFIQTDNLKKFQGHDIITFQKHYADENRYYLYLICKTNILKILDQDLKLYFVFMLINL
jgi:hypothetical protein